MQLKERRPRASAGGQEEARCPWCGAKLATTTEYSQGKGYLILWRCPGPHCGFRKVL